MSCYCASSPTGSVAVCVADDGALVARRTSVGENVCRFSDSRSVAMFAVPPSARRRRLSGAILVVLVLGVAPAVASADTPVVLCVPSGAGTAVTTAQADGSCPTGRTKRSLADQADLTAAEQRIAALEALLKGVSRGTVNGQPMLTVSGENVRIVNGAGKTASANGRGNLFLGYDGSPGAQGGSHNVVVGDANAVTSWGSLVVGQSNRSAGPGQTILGYADTAAGKYATVTGGHDNRAPADYAAVNGGGFNTASAFGSAIAGGCSNVTGADGHFDTRCNSGAGRWPTVAGGQGNSATGYVALVAGGESNAASNAWTSVTGGLGSNASGQNASVFGGSGNVASGGASSVTGGWSNTAGADYAGVIGGFQNEAVGELSLAAGGIHNTASGQYSAVGGGRFNESTDDAASVTGGCGNTAGAAARKHDPPARDDCAFPLGVGGQSVQGGLLNRAQGDNSSISGGERNLSSGGISSILGGAAITVDTVDGHSP
jgi:hypothetical protein